jgi:uncharacterized protein (DUF433 family)
MAMTDTLNRVRQTPHQQVRTLVGPDPNRPGPDRARLVDYGVPVWALIAHLQGLDGDISLVARDYMIPEEAVVAALAYYVEHQEAIDARIAINSAAA